MHLNNNNKENSIDDEIDELEDFDNNKDMEDYDHNGSAGLTKSKKPTKGAKSKSKSPTKANRSPSKSSKKSKKPIVKPPPSPRGKQQCYDTTHLYLPMYLGKKSKV